LTMASSLLQMNKNEITSITLNASGEYTGTWYIDGGDGSSVNNRITLKDTVNSKYLDATCTPFNVAGLAAINLVQGFDFSQTVETAGATLELTLLDGEVANNTTFHLDVKLKDEDDNVINYDGFVDLTMADASDIPIYWVQPDASNIISTAMSAGEALGASVDCEVQLQTTNTNPATITATLDYNGTILIATLEVSIGEESILEQALTIIQEILTIQPQTNNTYQQFSFEQVLTTKQNQLKRLAQNLGLEQVLTALQPDENITLQGLEMEQTVAKAVEHTESLYNNILLYQAVTKTRDQTLELIQAINLEQEVDTETFKTLSQSLSLLQELTAARGYSESTEQSFTIGQLLNFRIATANTTEQELVLSQALTYLTSLGYSLTQALTLEQQLTVVSEGTATIEQTFSLIQSIIASHITANLVSQSLVISQSVDNIFNRPQALEQTLTLSQELGYLLTGQQTILQQFDIVQILDYELIGANELAQTLALTQTLSFIYNIPKELTQSLVLEQSEDHSHIYLAAFEVLPSVSTITKGVTHTFNLTVNAKDNNGDPYIASGTINIGLRLRTNHASTPTDTISIATMDLVDGTGTVTGIYIDGPIWADLDGTIRAEFGGVTGFGDIKALAIYREINASYGMYYGMYDLVDSSAPLDEFTCTNWSSVGNLALNARRNDTTTSYGREAWAYETYYIYYSSYSRIRGIYYSSVATITLTAEDLLDFNVLRVYFDLTANSPTTPSSVTGKLLITNTAPTNGNHSGGSTITGSSLTYTGNSTYTWSGYKDFTSTTITGPGTYYFILYIDTILPCPIPTEDYEQRKIGFDNYYDGVTGAPSRTFEIRRT